MIGATAGYFLERRVERGREARRELAALRERERQWGALVQGRSGERTSALDLARDGARDPQQDRTSALLGFSHDLRGPLQVVQFGADVVRARCPGDAYLTGVVADMDRALQQMRRMLTDLVETAANRRATFHFASQRLDVPELAERLRRRLRALVHGRDIRTNVFVTRDAPDAIEIDPLLMDRIVDNLFTNAAKYTERGSIAVELHGMPEILVLQVTDTGCGIDPDAMGRIFEPGGSRLDARRGDSFGVGLSVVIRLLEQIGGHLEVMSKPGEGTTFWVHLPVRAQIDEHASGMRPRTSGEVTMSPVVRIRRLSA
jgi:signal transduction histidine kinase